MQASAITGRASVLLHDPTNVRWPITQLLGYLNDGQREVVIHRPDASVSNTSVVLASGNTKQNIPDDGIRLLNVIRNMGSDGASPGRPILIVDRDILDTQVPTWHTDDAQDDIKNYTFDPEDPKRFYVYPRAGAQSYVELAYSVPPTDCDTVGNLIALSDIYANALLDYVMYRAFSKDTEYADQPKSARYYESFLRSLGIKTQVDLATDPNND